MDTAEMLQHLRLMTLPFLAWLVIVGGMFLACYLEADSRRRRVYAAAGPAIFRFLLLMVALCAVCVALALLALVASRLAWSMTGGCSPLASCPIRRVSALRGGGPLLRLQGLL